MNSVQHVAQRTCRIGGSKSGEVSELFGSNARDVPIPLAPSFADFAGKVWESRYPSVLESYYRAFGRLCETRNWGVYEAANGTCFDGNDSERLLSADVGTFGVEHNSGGVVSDSDGDSSGVQPCGSDEGAGGASGTAERVVGVDEAVVSVRGRHYLKNKNKKVKAKQLRERRRGQVGAGFCETVMSQSSPVTSCPSYTQALSDAEREAKESLARRRAAENAVAERLAKMKLASLEDEKKCQEYADLKRQRVIQWTNEATAKSQQSLEKCKSIDPSSSASQYEIRQQAKALADSEAMVRSLTESVRRAYPDDWQEEIEACRPCGTTEYELAEAGGGY